MTSEYKGWDSYYKYEYETSGACKISNHDSCGWSKCMCDCGHPKRIKWKWIDEKIWNDINGNVEFLSRHYNLCCSEGKNAVNNLMEAIKKAEIDERI